MYADFESILEPIQGPNPVPTGPYTSEVTRHSPLVGVFKAYSCMGPPGPGPNQGPTEKLKIH